MKKNVFLDCLKDKSVPVQAWMWNPSVLFAEIISSAGYDSVCIDLQHGVIDFNDAFSMIGVIASMGVTPMVRIPSKDFGAISRVLDAGVYGVICPDVRTPEESDLFARACKYAPIGERGFSPIRPAIGSPQKDQPVSEHFSTQAENSSVMSIVQIEAPDSCRFHR